MANRSKQIQNYYGFPEPIRAPVGDPIVAKTDPTTSDIGYPLGKMWVNSVSGVVYALGAVAAGVATWTTLGAVSSTFTTISSGSFATTTAATAISLASGNVFTGTGTDAAVGFIFTPKGAGGIVLTSGNFTLTAGNLVLTLGNVTLTSGNLTLTSGALLLTLGNATLANGNLVFSAAGKGISLKSGANARIGQATLVLGTIAVANTSVTANTRVIVTRSNKNASTKVGSLETVISAGVGFTVTSLIDATVATETGDLSTVDWVLVESA